MCGVIEDTYTHVMREILIENEIDLSLADDFFLSAKSDL